MSEQSESIRLLSTLDSVWAEIRTAHPDVPPVILLAAPSEGGRAIGHFSALRWQHRTDGNLHEVVLFGEYLHRTPQQVMEVLLHEAAHACNFVRGIRDCSSNQYHNRSFKLTAEELGLRVTQRRNYGFAFTDLRPETEQRWAAQIERLATEIRIFRRGRRGRKLGVQTPNSRNLRASCACGFLIRVARSTLSATEILCSRCRQVFREG